PPRPRPVRREPAEADPRPRDRRPTPRPHRRPADTGRRRRRPGRHPRRHRPRPSRRHGPGAGLGRPRRAARPLRRRARVAARSGGRPGGSPGRDRGAAPDDDDGPGATGALVAVRALAPKLLAPALAVLAALAVSSLVLLGAGYSPADTWLAMARFGARPDSIVSVLDRAVPLYLSGLAAAAGFRMGLFNIGVEGQYRLAALAAAVVAAAVRLPAALHLAVVLVVAVAVGAAWAGVAALLKVRRGVHEVLSTLMLNFVAGGLVAAVLAGGSGADAGGLAGQTKLIAASGRMPALN